MQLDIKDFEKIDINPDVGFMQYLLHRPM